MVDLSKLNPGQKSAIVDTMTTNAVVLAGAGSGKTSTLTLRIAYLLDDMGIPPYQIMGVTFTNKAAGEIKHRVSAFSPNAHKMWLGTFHSVCVKILHKFGKEIGLTKFTIMDTSDAKSAVKEVMKGMNLSTDKQYVNTIMSKISEHKSNLHNPKYVAQRVRHEYDLMIAQVYQEYQNLTWKRKSIDFDDLIIYTVVLLKKCPDVLQWFHDNIKYVMVDESQDTNVAQFELIQLIAGTNNLFIVGDDWQSIYSFRNAKPEYLINFQSLYPQAKVIKLEQNYRSTQTIVNASNAVIKNNTVRTDKTMFSKAGYGDPILIHSARDQEDEAEWVAREINLLTTQGLDYKDVAVLYRTNSQSRAMEDKLMTLGIPYKVIGGVSFYDRKEIKDILCYLKVFMNPNDEINLRRMLSLQEGVGKKSVESIVEFGKINSLGLLDTVSLYPAKGKVQTAMARLVNVFGILQTPNASTDISKTIEHILAATGYLASLKAEDTPEAKTRVENIMEFLTIASEFQKEHPDADLTEFVDRISLTSKSDEQSEAGMVSLMTLHSAKGLEFEYVFMVGTEESILPHTNSIGTPEGIEEERRLAYVGITRAKKQLYITHARRRVTFNSPPSFNELSRFVKEIPEHLTMKI